MPLLMAAALPAGVGAGALAFSGNARADGCQLYNVNGNISCYLNTSGTAGSPAKSSGSDPIFDDQNGYPGGPGGQAADIDLVVGLSPHLYDYSQYDSKGNLLVASSPVNAVSVGGAGAQGSDATGGGFDKVGGDGGAGNLGGDVTVSVGTQVIATSLDQKNGISGITVISLGGEGGAAGKGNMDGSDGNAAPGGNGGSINATLDGYANSNFRSVFVSSQGGAGGRGRDWGTGYNSQGADATDGIGGNGGVVTASFLNASNNANNGFFGHSGVLVQSVGGNGGNGGEAEDVDGAQGGSGGLAGNGNNVSVTLASNVIMEEDADNDAALHVLSAGGSGGQGSSTGGSGGNAGAGGNAGNVSVVIDGSGGASGEIAANGTYAPGILAQSLGGNGGDGGTPSEFVIGPNGGAGSTGGTAGSVSVTGSGLVVRTGVYVDPTLYEGSPGVLAQSIGGGGGSGGTSKGVFAVGGDGGNGVNGNTVNIGVQSQVETFGFGSDGLAAQSIGGGGGKAGDASGSSVGLNYVIGGSGGGGGDGDGVTLTSAQGSRVLTHGMHSPGLLAQSIGGGGGQGGAAYSKSTSAGFGASMAVGGSGGAGGDACGSGCQGTTAENDGRIATDGSDSYGILAQSIGGGGGAGGAATAKSRVYAAEDVSISLSAALGGSGGQAGSGGTLGATNTGLITTGGEGAVGMLAQSIGGGGGAGGDSSSASTATGGEFDISASLSFGGKGGTAGNGGNATGSNQGLVLTTGESAAGLLVQSVGGGGGVGGAGDGQASSSGGTNKISASLTLGGTGAAGGDGYGATANNIGGTILTLGDGAFGIGAQSIGGGGGAGGGAAGSAKGEYSATVTLGANGGNGGNTYHIDGNGNEVDGVSVLNDAKSTVVTFGADANGIIAQSIGGGGGVGGKAGSNIATKKSDGAGGNKGSNAATAVSSLTAAFDANGSAALNNYLGLNNAVNFTNSLLADSTSQVAAVRSLADDDLDSELDDAAQSKGETDDDNESTSIDLSVALGAAGGSGGSAGLVSVTNDGEVATLGNHADAILAQAIGGGGGKGGAASTASSNDYSGNLSVGGSGGGGGYGGQVIVTNTGAIYTKGALAAGIVGESIAGGGGVGGVSASSVKSSSKNSGDDDANDGAFKSIALSVGGDGGSSFDSGQVRITSSGAISTAAHDSSGIVAQSVTGGGGIAKTLASDLEAAGGSASTHGGTYDVGFKFGGAHGETSGGSGLVNVTTQTGGTITTKGDNSYGILAQSISGGGGLQLGGTVTGSTVSDFFGTGKTTGSVNDDGTNSATSGNSGLFVTVGDAIQTYGENAIGVMAQSIGGGGGIAGGVAGQDSLDAAPVYFSGSKSASGNGGYINVTVNQGASVGTVGGYSPAMVLQSIGGGGGRVINDSNIFMGTAGGSGTGGAIDATINGTVWATNTGSAGILAQSMGDSTSNAPINITIGTTGKVIVGEQAIPTSANGASAGIYLDHGGTGANDKNGNPVVNTITNNGEVYTYGSQTNSVAVYSVAGHTDVINNGTMGGDILLTNGGGTGCFTNNGTFNAGDKVTVGACGVSNTGVMKLGASPLTIEGDLHSSAGSRIVAAADFSGKSAPALTIDGNATIAGQVEVHPTLMRKNTVTLATATGTLQLDPSLASAADTHLYSYHFDTDGQSLRVTPSAMFSAKAAGLGANQRAVADNLQSLFDGGATMDRGFTRLAGVADGDSYASSLASMSGKALGAFGAFRYNSSRDFAINLYGGCSTAPLETKSTDNCAWGRVIANGTEQQQTRDALGYRVDATAYQSGGQLQLSPDLAVTGSLAYEDSRLRDTDGSAHVDGQALLGGVGLLYTDGAMELSGGVDMADGHYRSERDVSVAGISDQARAKPQQWQVGAHLRAAYSFKMGENGFVRPFLEGHAIRVEDKAFTESGDSPFRLAVEGNADTALIGAAGVELGDTFSFANGMSLRPFASAAVEFGSNRDWTTTAHFADQPQGGSFDTTTAGPDTLGRFSVGAELLGSKNLSVSVQYVPEVGKDYHANTGVARLAYRF